MIKFKFFIFGLVLIFNSSFALGRLLQIGCINIFSERSMHDGVLVPEFKINNNELLYIAKVYNHVDKLNKRVFLVVEPLVNIKGDVQTLKMDVSSLYDKFISKKEYGCSILWHLKDESNFKILLITSKKVSIDKKDNLIGTNEVDLVQFMNNSIGFYLDENGHQIKDLSDEIHRFNRYISPAVVNKGNKKISKSTLNAKIKERKNLNFYYFKKYQKYLNSEIAKAIKEKKLNESIFKEIKYFSDVINKPGAPMGNALKDLNSVFPDRNKYMKFE